MLTQLRSTIAATFLIGSAIAAQAAIVTYDFTAVGRSSALGATVVGSISYDTMAAPTGTSSFEATYAMDSFEVTVTGGPQDGGAFDFATSTL